MGGIFWFNFHWSQIWDLWLDVIKVSPWRLQNCLSASQCTGQAELGCHTACHGPLWVVIFNQDLNQRNWSRTNMSVSFVQYHCLSLRPGSSVSIFLILQQFESRLHQGKKLSSDCPYGWLNHGKSEAACTKTALWMSLQVKWTQNALRVKRSIQKAYFRSLGLLPSGCTL